jgi:hypothetical protein
MRRHTLIATPSILMLQVLLSQHGSDAKGIRGEGADGHEGKLDQ